jgi:hypothetical protein
MNKMANGFNLDNFVLPDGAAEAIAKQNLQAVQLDDGVSRLTSGHDKGIAFRFFVHTEYNAIESKKKGYEVFDEIEMIEWLVDKGLKPVERVKFLPPALLATDLQGKIMGGRYYESYKRFKEGKKTPGLPLSKWGVLSDSDVATLAANSIFSVEQLAEQDRSVLAGKFPPSFLDALDRAIVYVQSKGLMSTMEASANKLESLERENKKLQERLSAMEALTKNFSKPAAKASVGGEK